MGNTHIITLLCNLMSQIEGCYTFTVPECIYNEHSLQLYCPISVLLSHLHAIQGHSTSWWHCDAGTGKDVLSTKRMGSQLGKILKKAREINWHQSRREVSKTIAINGMSKFLDMPPVTHVLCKEQKNASGETERNNNVMHYSWNNPNNANNSSNGSGPCFVLPKSL